MVTEKDEIKIKDWERRQIEINSAANTLALCTQLVCLTALCTGSWIHCIHARVVATPSECIQLNKELHRHSLLLPASSSSSLSVPLRLVSSWLLSHSHKQRMRKWERNKALVPHALTQHLCLSWFQMNKEEYQVAHLYATQRQIDQSITAGCCWITNALWCVCMCVCKRGTRQPFFYLLFHKCICVYAHTATVCATTSSSNRMWCVFQCYSRCTRCFYC